MVQHILQIHIRGQNPPDGKAGEVNLAIKLLLDTGHVNDWESNFTVFHCCVWGRVIFFLYHGVLLADLVQGSVTPIAKPSSPLMEASEKA